MDTFYCKDLLLYSLNSGEENLRRTIAHISEEEYNWELLQPAEKQSDLPLPPQGKNVWRVFEKDGNWTYDYTPEPLDPPPFTTIAWILNHIAQTADMYLYCIQSGRAEGVERTWDDLPVHHDLDSMSKYAFEVIDQVRSYLKGIPEELESQELLKLTPAPWGEMRCTFVNLWGGIIEHILQHAMQIAVRKDRIRYGY